MWPVLLKPPQFYLLFGHIWAPDPIYSYELDISIWLFHWYFNLKYPVNLSKDKLRIPPSWIPSLPSCFSSISPFSVNRALNLPAAQMINLSIIFDSSFIYSPLSHLLASLINLASNIFLESSHFSPSLNQAIWFKSKYHHLLVMWPWVI